MSKLSFNDVIQRRLAFLLNEAKSPNPTYDQSVIYTLRVLSNYFTIGRDVSSGVAKLENRRMSLQAQKFLHECADKEEWKEGTTNEHPEPLKGTWSWITEQNQNLTLEDLAARLAINRMVTVTKDEDGKLCKNGYRSKGAPEERYAEITIVEIDIEPREIIARKKKGLH